MPGSTIVMPGSTIVMPGLTIVMPGLTGHLRLLPLQQFFPPGVADHDGRRQLGQRLQDGAAALSIAIVRGYSINFERLGQLHFSPLWKSFGKSKKYAYLCTNKKRPAQHEVLSSYLRG